MKLHVNCSLDTATGDAAAMEIRNIQGRAAFLQSRVITIEKATKEKKKTNERPRKMDAAMSAIPTRKAMTGFLSPAFR